MLFNSIEYIFFLPIVFILYWFVFHYTVKLQNLFVLCASYIFYGFWNSHFLLLIFASTVVDYSMGILMGNKSKEKKKVFLYLSLMFNLGLLAYFKYCNFFIDSFNQLIGTDGGGFSTLDILLPVGISFYTFQTLSYTIDVYRGKIKPTKDFVKFAAYVSYFPQLVAGPIERASHLLPQFSKKRIFQESKARDGIRQILWGFFKKLVIADNCAVVVNVLFEDPSAYSGGALLLGAVFFAFQIYGDFSGYSDIAIGTSRLFGIDLNQNFAFPYFSRNIAEFWRRWHISLSTWFRDYLYIPLGGSREGKWKAIRNVFIIFLVSGFWHGANWTFIAWGGIHALLFLPLLVTNNNRKFLDYNTGQLSVIQYILNSGRIILTFLLVVLAWVFFRADNLSHAIEYLTMIFDFENWSSIEIKPLIEMPYLWGLIIFFLAVEWVGKLKKHALEIVARVKYRILRWTIYSFILFLIGAFMQTEEVPFIYFQF